MSLECMSTCDHFLSYRMHFNEQIESLSSAIAVKIRYDRSNVNGMCCVRVARSERKQMLLKINTNEIHLTMLNNGEPFLLDSKVIKLLLIVKCKNSYESNLVGMFTFFINLIFKRVILCRV